DDGGGAGRFTWLPGNDQAGVYDVGFEAEDGNGHLRTIETRITVIGETLLRVVWEPTNGSGEEQSWTFTPSDGTFIARAGFTHEVAAALLLPDRSWNLSFQAPF